jgi:hypothetical protein
MTPEKLKEICLVDAIRKQQKQILRDDMTPEKLKETHAADAARKKARCAAIAIAW